MSGRVIQSRPLSADDLGMDRRIERALAAPRPGRSVRLLSRILPGVAQTRRQIEQYADHWRHRAIESIESGAAPVVAIGDSLAQGIGASSPDHGFVAAVASRLVGDDGPVVNLSRSGARLVDVLEHQLPALTALPVDPVVVLCTVGSNDLVRSSRIRRARQEMHDLLDALPPNAVVATVPAAGSLVAKRFNRSVRSAAVERRVTVADVGRELRSWKGRMAADRFHPNDAGHQLWAEVFERAIAGLGNHRLNDQAGQPSNRL